MANEWQKPLDVDGKNLRILGKGSNQVLFSVQQPGVPFRWEQIVQSNGNIFAARTLPIIVPEDVPDRLQRSVLELIHWATPARCAALFIHEKRPYPALVKDAVGETLCEMPGGIIEASDVSVASAAVREFLEEIGADPKRVLAQMPLLSVPAPVSAGAQIEGQSLYCVVYRAQNEFRPTTDEPIAKVNVVPLTEAYRWLLGRHERREECTEMKTLLALLILQEEYRRAYGVSFYAKKEVAE